MWYSKVAWWIGNWGHGLKVPPSNNDPKLCLAPGQSVVLPIPATVFLFIIFYLRGKNWDYIFHLIAEGWRIFFKASDPKSPQTKTAGLYRLPDIRKSQKTTYMGAVQS